MLTRFFNRRFDHSQLSIQQWLLLSSLFSIALLIARILTTGHFTYLFLVWNLFLGVIPYAISQLLIRNPRIVGNRFKLLLSLAAWLLFIPNSFYILTDLFHLEQFDTAPRWFDLLLLFSFTWNGILFGIISMQRIELINELMFGRKVSLLIVLIVMWLNAFGIYIGRYLRYNSWDVITQPFSLFSELFEILFHPIRNRMEWSMISVYAIFMTLLYVTVKKLADSFNTNQLKN